MLVNLLLLEHFMKPSLKNKTSVNVCVYAISLNWRGSDLTSHDLTRNERTEKTLATLPLYKIKNQ